MEFLETRVYFIFIFYWPKWIIQSASDVLLQVMSFDLVSKERGRELIVPVYQIVQFIIDEQL